MSTDRIRETSFACLLVLGLKSHSRATLSHSDPGLLPSLSARKASSDALRGRGRGVLESRHFNWMQGGCCRDDKLKHPVLRHKIHVNEQQPFIEYTMQATQYMLQKYSVYEETGKYKISLTIKMLILALKLKPLLIPQWGHLHALGKQINLGRLK